jgi:solute carrier family 29 (equilibrative nucleoside transporter), member 1/2/3
VQIASVLSVPPKGEGNISHESTTSAFAYFLTATVISALTIVAFSVLVSRHGAKGGGKRAITAIDGEDEPLSASEHVSIPLTRLFHKLFWLAGAIFLAFAITMFFPVFTQQILSVRPVDSAPRLFAPSSFIPLAFLFWNSGDLLGRLLPAIPALSLSHRPRLLFFLSLARIIWIPLYFLCNIKGNGAAISSDFFYLVFVQLLFGITNGYIGSQCMIAFAEWVDVEERPAAGGFMSLCLVAGLSVGSLLSFIVADKI